MSPELLEEMCKLNVSPETIDSEIKMLEEELETYLGGVVYVD